MKKIKPHIQEHVVLVDEKNSILGVAPKIETHHSNTPLHRGFSLFLFNNEKKLLLQQRSSEKKTWPLVWSNSLCGHPQRNETIIKAVRRRLHYELGVTTAKLFLIDKNYRYRYEKDDIVENEICPILIGFCEQDIRINHNEIEQIQWVPWEKWLEEVRLHKEKYSPWSIDETTILKTNPTFMKLFSRNLHSS